MFPGCTELEMRVRNLDLLREAEYSPTPHRYDRIRLAESRGPLVGWVLHYIAMLAAFVGLA